MTSLAILLRWVREQLFFADSSFQFWFVDHLSVYVLGGISDLLKLPARP